jgi:hypothetical protein
MGKHYLPQAYLKGFENDERLWAYDRVEERSFRSQAKSVANETNMYSDELEGVLAARIEDPAKLAIDKARARQSIDEDDRRALATYAVCLWKRVPGARVRVAAALPEVGENVRNELHRQLETELAAKPHLAELAASRRAEINHYVERYVNERADEIWQLTLQEGQSAAVIDAMLAMDWRFLISTDEQFLTCDNPVYFHRHEGIGNAESELTIPLSSGVALWATRQRQVNPAQYLVASRQAVLEINRRTAASATRYVFAASDSPWILPFVCKTGHRLTRLR